jgi:stage II sporulation protein P
MCIYFESEKLLFSGDTLFYESIGRTDFPGGSYASISDSIKNKLYPLGDNVKVYPGHNSDTTILHEKESNFYTDEFNSRTTDNNKNMAKIGSIVAEKLNAAGIKTLHDTTKHDYPEYSGSYNRSAKTVNSYLKKYKSIKIVLDLHRDAVSSGSDKVKLVTEINGKKAAQVMLVMGSESGSITNHPNWKENLKLALKLQQTMESKYPTLARPLSLMSKKYNQSLSEGALLIEFGTDVNTLDEACYSAKLVADSLVSLLNTLQ